MKIPDRLIPLVEDGIIEEVIGQVKSGKEADVFVVRVGEEMRCAKVYKDANNRSFRQAVQYQEGRKVRNSRDARAIGKRSRYGQKEAESSWINAEVEALNTLSAAGLRVPKPFGFFDGVLIMELVMGEDGEPAPRLNDISLSAETAFLYHEEMIAQVVKMLCCGIIHGDLSEFNVLVDADGPVIIDLPQAVNAAGNNSAAMMFARDVDNMARYFGRFAPEILGLKYAKEIWALYEKGKLTPHVELTGEFKEPTRKVDVSGVLDAIGDARKEHEDKLKPPGARNDRGDRNDPGGRVPGHDRTPGHSGNPRQHGQQGNPRHPGQAGNQRQPGSQGQPGPQGQQRQQGNSGRSGNPQGNAGGQGHSRHQGHQGPRGSQQGNPKGNSGNRNPGGHGPSGNPGGQGGPSGQGGPRVGRPPQGGDSGNRPSQDGPQWGRRNPPRGDGRPR